METVEIVSCCVGAVYVYWCSRYVEQPRSPLALHSCYSERTCANIPGLVAIAGYFINYAVDTWPGTDSAKGAKLLAGAQGAFAVGRFLGSGIMKYTRARYVFGIYLSCCVAFLAASVTQRNQTGIGMYLDE